MDSELREKFETVLNSQYALDIEQMEGIDLETAIALSCDKDHILNAMQAAYNLAMAESAEKIEAQQSLIETYESSVLSQQQLLESMSETNKQLAKRLQLIESVLELTDPVCRIREILNPTTSKIVRNEFDGNWPVIPGDAF